MSEQSLTTLKAETERILQLLDSMELDALGATLNDDAHSVDEITRGWTRGRAAIGAYLEQLRGTVSDIQPHAREPHAIIWGDTGIVTFVLKQTYTLNETHQRLEALTSMVFRRIRDSWKVALIQTVPLPADANS